ncbi:hypothetical protein [Actinoplanes couchii]|uniref:Uncharacterized protein n=1 Tax=Actinoplanes couchii TaxID=403638 RepID=A0ABQ3XKU8_9ACTN|nr:hypothetical protein [Actinoplanes couchii]MDR6319548.1 hypothetical protein [Actinoplanes couchii]GID59062.1 hypothetical protein Aco03nite_074660 [Actinoplanes couchii]
MKLDQVTMPGQVWGLATTGPAGPIFVTSYGTGRLDVTVLTAVDPAGRIIWQREFDGHPQPPRAIAAGTVWLTHLGPGGHTFTEVSPDGEILRSVVPDHRAHEHLGAFVVLPDGFCVIWLPARRQHHVPAGETPRVVRHTATGATAWSAPLTLTELSFSGIVGIGVDTGGEIRPVKPWEPRTIWTGSREPLLVAGDRVLAEIKADSASSNPAVP